MDRIDIFIQATAQSYKQLNSKGTGESSSSIRERVKKARNIQRDRFAGEGVYCNAQMNSKLIKKYCKLESKCSNIIEAAFDKYRLSTRGYSRILKLSRTIADLSGRNDILHTDVIEALQYREFLNCEEA
jgi:magnesium chelatase family protein